MIANQEMLDLKVTGGASGSPEALSREQGYKRGISSDSLQQLTCPSLVPEERPLQLHHGADSPPRSCSGFVMC